MKKAFSLLAVLILIFAAGCENQQKAQETPPPVPEKFSSDINITYGDVSMTAVFTRNLTDEFVIDFVKPEALNPLLLNFKNGICTVDYDGLQFEADFNRFPQTETGALLINAVSDAAQGFEIQKLYSDGIWTYKGTGERGAFTLTQDAESGALLEFKTEGAQLHIVFSNFKIN